MNKIKVGATEIEVVALRPYAYVNGKNEKFLKIEVSADVADFGYLRELLENTEETIEYYEEGELKCSYVGYGKFEVQYKEDVYTIEMHKTSIVEQMSALLNANETLALANATLQETTGMLIEQNEVLTEQNTMLTLTLSDVLEGIIPATMDEILGLVMMLEERVLMVETILNETVTDETVPE